MPQITFSLDDLAREATDYARQSARAQQRLAAWRDEEPQHAHRHVVLTRGKLQLYHYAARTGARAATPLLLVYSLVNRPYVLDLAPAHSVIEDLCARGQEVYLLDWGYPDREDLRHTLADYIAHDLDACVEVVRARHRLAQVNLLGVCQGGTFCLCYAALYGTKIKNLVTVATPVDFHTANDLLSHLLRQVDSAALVAAYGNLAGDFLNALFIAQKPLQFAHQKYINFVARADDEAASTLFLALERWIFDSPALAGAAFREFTEGCYQGNGLALGTLQVGGQTIHLQDLQMPVLNVIARDDHLVPPAASRALRGLVGTIDYTELELPAGHIGIFISAQARATLVEVVVNWLAARDSQAAAPQQPAKKRPRKRPRSADSA